MASASSVAERMDLRDLSASVLRISDIYAAEHDIDRDRDWALLKLQEELGELTAELAERHVTSGNELPITDPVAVLKRVKRIE